MATLMRRECLRRKFKVIEMDVIEALLIEGIF